MNGRGERVQHLAEGYKNLVAQEARKWWLKLPAHTRVWVSLEDLIEQGMCWVMMQGVPRWDRKKSALSTFLYSGLQNKFSDIVMGLRRQRRNDFREISLEQLMAQQVERKDFVVVPRAVRDVMTAQTILKDCFVVPLVMDVYRKASNPLKNEIIQWFVPKGGRVRLDTPKFYRACFEFRRLAQGNGLAYEDCEHLLASPHCLGALTTSLGFPVPVWLT